MNLMELSVKIGVDTSDLDKGIDDVKKSAVGLKDVFSGNILADFVKSAVSSFAQIAKESIDLASDLNEVQNVVDVTFGDGARQINQWAKSAKNAFGMGELNAKKFAGTMGAMLKSMGMTDEQTMQMSTSLVQLAGDMASFYNLDHETAFDKIRAGISGETEPLKQLGINMSVANLEAYAMSQGIKKVYSEMSQAEQAALRYNYLLQATAGAQGDFARTSDSYAAQMRLFDENITAIKANLGTSLLEFVTPALTSFNEWYNNLPKTNPVEEVKEADQDEQKAIEEADKKYRKANSLIEIIDNLQNKMELSEEETLLWEKSLQELVKIFPELAGVIDLTNMSINGTTEELKAATSQAWNSARETAALNALKTKEEARATALQYAVEAELTLEMKKAEIDYDNLKALYQAEVERMKSVGLTPGESKLDMPALLEMRTRGYTLEEAQNSQDLFFRYYTAEQIVKAYTRKYKDAYGEYEEVNEEYEKSRDILTGLVEKYKETEEEMQKTTEAQEAYNKAVENQKTAFENFKASWDAVKQYRDEVQQTMRDSLKKGTDELWSVVVDMTDVDVKGSLATAKNNLAANLAFYTEYAAGIQAAQQAGVDSGLLAELSTNQSAENKALLDYIKSGASSDEITELNKQWRNMNAAKESLAQTMTDAVLDVDSAYKQMVEEALAATNEFNQADQARANALATGQGVVAGLDIAIPEIQAEVEKINGILGQIGLGTINMDLSLEGIGAVAGELSGLPDKVASAAERGTSNAHIDVTVNAVSVGAAVTPYVEQWIQRNARGERFNRAYELD